MGNRLGPWLGLALGTLVLVAPAPLARSAEPLITDVAGDANRYVVRGSEGVAPSEPSLDIRTGDLAYDSGTADSLGWTVGLEDRGSEPAGTAVDREYSVAFLVEGVFFRIYVIAEQGRPLAYELLHGAPPTGPGPAPLTPEECAGCAATIDTGADRVTLVVPLATVGSFATVGPGSVLSRLEVGTWRRNEIDSGPAAEPATGPDHLGFTLSSSVDDAGTGATFTIPPV